MGLRGPQPAERPGKMIGAHCKAEVVDELEQLVEEKGYSQSSIAAKCIEAGIPVVRKKLAPKGEELNLGGSAKKAETKPAAKKTTARTARAGSRK